MKRKNITKTIFPFRKIAIAGATVLVAGVMTLTLPEMTLTSFATENGEVIVPEGTGAEGGASVVQPVATPEPVTPTVMANVYENYSAAYQMYEESMNDMFFFYCNVSNGSFVSEPVYFDFPGNITYVVEKDGAEIKYKSGAKIKDVGNYVVRLSAEYNGTNYIATFRFALREALATEPEATVSQDAEAGSQIDFGELDTEDMGLGDLSPEDLIFDPNDDVTDEEIAEMIEQSGANMVATNGSGLIDGVQVNPYTGFLSSFERANMMYSITLASGEKIITNVPSGALVNGGVIMTVPEGVQTTVYKDGELMDEGTSLNFSEPGVYKVCFYVDSTQFYRFYSYEDKYPFYTFRIVGQAVNDIEVFTAPAGCKIVSVEDSVGYVSDENGNKEFEINSFWMEEEGRYTFSVYDPVANGTYTVVVNRDLTAPEAHVNTTKATADIYLDSSDIANVDIYRNGELIQYSNNIIGKGNYTMQVYDYAGNVSTYTFTLADAFNQGTFFAVLLSVLIILSGFVYIRLQRTYVRVR